MPTAGSRRECESRSQVTPRVGSRRRLVGEGPAFQAVAGHRVGDDAYGKLPTSRAANPQVGFGGCHATRTATLSQFTAVEVHYKNNAEDFATFAAHEFQKRAAYRWRCLWDSFWGERVAPLILIAFITIVGGGTAGLTQQATAVAGSLLLALATYYWFRRKSIEEHLRDQLQKDILRSHTLLISPGEFIERSHGTDQFIAWKSLHRITYTPDFIFIRATPAVAHIIPRRELGDIVFQELSDRIRRFRSAPVCRWKEPPL